MEATSHPLREELAALIEHLASSRLTGDTYWRGWQVERIAGAGNNLLYRASGPPGKFAVKFTTPDQRDRAGREFNSLMALSGLGIAPEPVLLERAGYAYPVVVQTWLEGETGEIPPATDSEWDALLEHLATVHSLTPESSRVKLPLAVVSIRTAGMALQRVQKELDFIPRQARPAGLQALADQAGTAGWPLWPVPQIGLCRCDPNILNFIRRPGAWASVDWENSGWGDPAFEIGDLLAHPAYVGVSRARRDWVIYAYCMRTQDPDAEIRIRIYYALTLVWWAARLARTAYEAPLGLETRRLATRPARWRADLDLQIDNYLDRASESIAPFM